MDSRSERIEKRCDGGIGRIDGSDALPACDEGQGNRLHEMHVGADPFGKGLVLRRRNEADDHLAIPER
ncbi:hypothetical protein ACVIOG_006521 [Rhizobium leguminosarum]